MREERLRETMEVKDGLVFYLSDIAGILLWG